MREIELAEERASMGSGEQDNQQAQRPLLATATVLDALKTFCQKIASTIEEGKREGVLRPTEEVDTRYPIDERSIKQGEFGLDRTNFATEEVTKESWFSAMRAVVWRLQESLEWSAILTVLEQTVLSPENAKRLGSVKCFV
ncbi:MAG: hypothetical protein M3R52_08850 [Acidobacteriota bacterium]|nr:hypothetical protein [Acidobacteriota bacterium]